MLVVLEILFLSPPDVRMLAFTAFIQIFIIMAGYASDVARSKRMFDHAFILFGVACAVYTAYFSTQWYLFYKGTSISDAPSVVYIFVSLVHPNKDTADGRAGRVRLLHVFAVCGCAGVLYVPRIQR